MGVINRITNRLNKRLIHHSFLQELKIWKDERKRFLDEAVILFSKNEDKKGSLADYRKALNRHRVTYSEYLYGFEYWKRTEKQRNEFVSCSEMQCIYRKMIPAAVRRAFMNKDAFLERFHEFVYRDWMVVGKSAFDEFQSMVTRYDCIAKPLNGTRGAGIFKIEKKTRNDCIQDLYVDCCEKNILLEQCIHAHPSIEAFHPASLNTIRVVTVSNSDSCRLFGAVLRMGVGNSYIDNTHSGGIYASVDPDTGIVDSDGIDSKGNRYVSHPDSGIVIKGFQVPFWEHVVSTCQKASHVVPDTVFAGWDLCILDDGRVELIEGNHAPDFDGGMQAPHKIGVKQRIQTVVKEMTGIDPLELIPVYSKTFNGYRFFD